MPQVIYSVQIDDRHYSKEVTYPDGTTEQEIKNGLDVYAKECVINMPGPLPDGNFTVLKTWEIVQDEKSVIEEFDYKESATAVSDASTVKPRKQTPNNTQPKTFGSLIKPIIILAALIYVGFFIVYEYHTIQGDSYFAEANYAQALNEYEKAQQIYNAPALPDKINKAYRGQTTKEDYDEAIGYADQEEYAKALSELRRINADSPYYDDATQKIAEYEILYTAQKFTSAQTDYANGDYVGAYQDLEYVLEHDSNNEEAKALQPSYHEAYLIAKEASDLKQQEATEKRVAEQKAAAEAEKQKYAPQKIVDTDEKKIWEIYIKGGTLHFTADYQGDGYFGVTLSDSNQDLVDVIVNEIGSYKADTYVSVPYEGWYYLKIEATSGHWTANWQ